jgi:DNA repair ATPase RecN
MRFRDLRIENFRGIRRLALEGLRDLVVVAGPNGCGKSAVLDAIRLMKSFYGGYQANEWHQWMGEFQINISKPQELGKLFGDPSRALIVEATIDLAEDEATYLRDHAEEVLEPIIWSRLLGRSYSGALVSANELRQYGDQVASQCSVKQPSFDQRWRTQHSGQALSYRPWVN